MLKFKAFTRIEANRQKLPYDITALDSWFKNCNLRHMYSQVFQDVIPFCPLAATDGKLYFIVCWEKCHVGIYEFLTNGELLYSRIQCVVV